MPATISVNFAEQSEIDNGSAVAKSVRPDRLRAAYVALGAVNQTIGGTKTFSNTIEGSINGNAATVTNGVYTTGNQTIGGNKRFSGFTQFGNASISSQTFRYSSNVNDTGQNVAIIDGGNVADVNLAQIRYSINTSSRNYAAYLKLAKSNSDTIGTHAKVVSTQPIGGIAMFGSDGTKFVAGASIDAEAVGSPTDITTNCVPMRLRFCTRNAGDTDTLNERMVIGSAGLVTINNNLDVQAPSLANAPSHICVFNSDPSTVPKTISTRTPAEIRSDIGANNASNLTAGTLDVGNRVANKTIDPRKLSTGIKAWGFIDSAGFTTNYWGLASVARLDTGRYAVNFEDSVFTNDRYAVVLTPHFESATGFMYSYGRFNSAVRVACIRNSDGAFSNRDFSVLAVPSDL